MEVYSVTVDKKPKWCMFCPIKATSVKIKTPKCGKTITTAPDAEGWSQGGDVPDERCILLEKEIICLN